MWLGSAAIVLYSGFFTDESDGDIWQDIYLVFSVLVLGAGILGLLAAIGVSKRHGGLGTLGTVGLVITGVGVLTSVIAWAIPLWMGLQGLGLLILGIVVWGRGMAPKWSTAFVAAGFPIGIVTFTVAVAAKLGERDEYGDYPQAWGLGTAVGVSLVAIGLIGWGLWLRSEEPADIDGDPPITT
jgi:hypothetical protein